MDINCLPDELFEDIAYYLDLEELLSCSLVCQRWRNVFNSNRIWFYLCKKKATLYKNETNLITDTSYVPPQFHYPCADCEPSGTPCFWKLRYMQEAHLNRNWRIGRYLSFKIATTDDSQLIECDDNVITITSLDSREFSTWSIRHQPVKIQTAKYSLQHVLADFFKLVKNVLVVVQCTLLQVYYKSPDNTFYLRHRCLFDMDESGNKIIPPDPDISEWYKDKIGLYPSDLSVCCDHNGDHFCAVIVEGSTKTAKIHVWDLKSCTKSLVFQIPPTTGSLIMDIHFLLKRSDLFILLGMRSTGGAYSLVYKYNLEKFSYSDIQITFAYVSPICLLSDRYFLNGDQTRRNLYIWDKDTGKFVYKLCCEYDINIHTLQFATASSILYSEDSMHSGIIRLFDIKKLETTFELSINHRVTEVLVIRNDFMMIGGKMRLSVWDMKSSKKLHTLDYVGCVWSNINSSKIVVESQEELYLVHFW